jgi:hypothetical protein
MRTTSKQVGAAGQNYDSGVGAYLGWNGAGPARKRRLRCGARGSPAPQASHLQITSTYSTARPSHRQLSAKEEREEASSVMVEDVPWKSCIGRRGLGNREISSGACCQQASAAAAAEMRWCPDLAASTGGMWVSTLVSEVTIVRWREKGR